MQTGNKPKKHLVRKKQTKKKPLLAEFLNLDPNANLCVTYYIDHLYVDFNADRYMMLTSSISPPRLLVSHILDTSYMPM